MSELFLGGNAADGSPIAAIKTIGIDPSTGATTSGRTLVCKPIAAVAITAGTPVVVWTPAAGKKFRLIGFALGLSVAGAVLLKDNNTEFLRTQTLAAGTGTESPEMGSGYLSSAANNALKVDASASGTVNGFVCGYEE